MPENWGSSVIVPLYKGKGEMTEFSHSGGNDWLIVAGKIYAGTLADRVRRVTEGSLMMNSRVSDYGGGV